MLSPRRIVRPSVFPREVIGQGRQGIGPRGRSSNALSRNTLLVLHWHADSVSALIDAVGELRECPGRLPPSSAAIEVRAGAGSRLDSWEPGILPYAAVSPQCGKIVGCPALQALFSSGLGEYPGLRQPVRWLATQCFTQGSPCGHLDL